MSKFSIVLTLLLLVGCGNGTELVSEVDNRNEKERLYADAVVAEQEGRVGDSEIALEKLLILEGDGPDNAIAVEMLEKVRKQSVQDALEALRLINEAQSNFKLTRRRYAISIEELVDQLMLSDDPSRSDIGYEITMRGSPNADRYSVTARPTSGTSVKRTFFCDESSVLRWSLGEVATRESPPLDKDH